MTICPFDASGCGFIVYTDDDGNIINLEGDPDHPINRGAACAKGAAIAQIHNNDRRLQHVMYRAPGAAEWEEKSWEWTLSEIAQRIKTTRDEHWISQDDAGTLVNRTDAMASVGGSALDNEECYLLVKALRSIGLAFIEHHARL
jgi:formate dehydrogenase major subunit